MICSCRMAALLGAMLWVMVMDRPVAAPGVDENSLGNDPMEGKNHQLIPVEPR